MKLHELARMLHMECPAKCSLKGSNVSPCSLLQAIAPPLPDQVRAVPGSRMGPSCRQETEASAAGPSDGVPGTMGIRTMGIQVVVLVWMQQLLWTLSVSGAVSPADPSGGGGGVSAQWWSGGSVKNMNNNCMFSRILLKIYQNVVHARHAYMGPETVAS